MDDTECGCGEPLHYTDPIIERGMQAQVQRMGYNIVVSNDAGHAYLVPRHYIALHGIKEAELDEIATRYGFQSVPLPKAAGGEAAFVVPTRQDEAIYRRMGHWL